jgi:raffinose/stachyose/melibiose transport system permease protein
MVDQIDLPPAPATTTRREERGPSWRRHFNAEKLVVPAFLAPALFFIGVYLLWPIAGSIELSFFSWNGSAPREFIGLDNWRALLNDSVFWQAFRNNLLLIGLSIIIQMPIAMALAVLLDRIGRRLSKVLRVAYFLPLLLSVVAIGVLFRNIYNPAFGLLNTSLETIGLESLTRPWLADPSTALFAIIVVVSWQFIPFYMVLFAAALADLSADYHDAAKVDGATESQYFFRVALPQMKPVVGVAIALSIIGSLRYFDLVWVMTGGGPVHATELMATYMFRMAFRSSRMGYGATIASALFLTVLISSLAVLVWRARRRRLEEARGR